MKNRFIYAAFIFLSIGLSSCGNGGNNASDNQSLTKDTAATNTSVNGNKSDSSPTNTGSLATDSSVNRTNNGTIPGNTGGGTNATSGKGNK